MKGKYLGIFAALLFVLALFGMSTLVAPTEKPNTQAEQITAETETAAFEQHDFVFAGSPIRKTVTDTITNAEKDTLTVAGTLLSPYYYNVQGFRTSLSGTHNVKIYLDASGKISGTDDWVAVDSTSATTATLYRMSGIAYALRYRIRVSGTGSQSSRYQVNYAFKPLN